MQPTRLGIIGPGLVWQSRHRPALDKLDDAFTIAGFCAASDRHQAEVARDYPGVAFVTDVQALVRRDDIDAVVVLTPIPLNGPVALAALQAGKDVFVEKPVAHDLHLGLALVETAQRMGKRLWVLEQDTFATRWQRVREAVHSGEIGELVMYDQVIHWPLDEGQNARRGYGHTAWRIRPDFPLGMLFDGGHHQIATLSMLFGRFWGPARIISTSGVTGGW